MAEPAPTDGDDEPVPKIPYARGLKLDRPMMFRIGATVVLLVMIVVAARPCADATSKFVTGFGDEKQKGSASDTMPKPGNVDQPAPTPDPYDQYEQIGPNMTDAERRAAIERAKAKGRANGAGSAGSAADAGSGSNR